VRHQRRHLPGQHPATPHRFRGDNEHHGVRRRQALLQPDRDQVAGYQLPIVQEHVQPEPVQVLRERLRPLGVAVAIRYKRVITLRGHSIPHTRA